MKKIRLPIRNSKAMYIVPLVVFLAWVVISVIIGIFGSIIVGAIFCGVYVLIWFFIYLFIPVFVVAEGDSLKEISLFGIVRKKKKFSELKSVKKGFLTESGRGMVMTEYYYILNFSDKNHDYEYVNDYFAEDDTIIFEPTFKSAEVLRKYMHFLVGENEMQFYAFGDLLVNANENVVCAMTDRADATAEYKRWGNLKSLKNVYLRGASGMYEKYYLLNFTDEPKEYETLGEARKNCDVIVLEQTEQTERFLKKYLGDSKMP